MPIIAINKHTGKIESAPEIVSRGFGLESDAEFMRAAREVVVKTLEGSSAEEKMDVGVMKEKIRADLKRYIHRQRRAAAADYAGDSGDLMASPEAAKTPWRI